VVGALLFVFGDRTQPLDCLNDDELITRYRLPRKRIVELDDELSATETARCLLYLHLPYSTKYLLRPSLHVLVPWLTKMILSFYS